MLSDLTLHCHPNFGLLGNTSQLLKRAMLTLGRPSSLRSWVGLVSVEPCGGLCAFISSCYLGTQALDLLLVELFLCGWSAWLTLFSFLNQHQLYVPCLVQYSTGLALGSP